MKANSTRIVALLDASGSMSSIINDMKGGFIQFIEEQKKLDGELTLTVVTFDDQYMPFFQGKLIEKDTVIDLTAYRPRGMTALIESFCNLIDAEGVELAKLPEDQRPEKVLFICITDGQENCSGKDYTRKLLADKISHQRDKYGWQFVFMGANQDSFAEGASIGVSAGATRNYVANSKGVMDGFMSLTASTSSYRSRSSAGGQSVSFQFEDDDDKKA